MLPTRVGCENCCGNTRKRKSEMGRQARWLWIICCASASAVRGATYYVSPLGNDSNNGTSSTAPWGTVAKVDSTTFQPGDQILFQYGSTWNAGLAASSDGSTAAPIVYGAYGNPGLGNPTFSGSDTLNASAFTVVSGTTYSTTVINPVNWIFDNHQFTHEAQDALTQAGSSSANNPAADLNYVQTNPGSFYFNASSNRLYVNVGSSLAGHVITAATRQDVINSNAHNNLIFQNLNATETAADNGGYDIRIQGSSNVRLLNSTASLGGKHNVGAINATGFVGTNLTANGSAPDQGFGGASAFVAYSDANPNRPNNQNNTYVWNNLTYLNSNGAYPAFISHGDPGAIASVAVNNVVSLNGYGTGIEIMPSSSTETASVQGGHLDGGQLEVDTNNSLVDSVLVTGATGSISVGGTNSVVQNNVLSGVQPNLYAGRNGAITDSGTNNTIRFNVAAMSSEGPGIGLLNANSSSSIYGNIFYFPSGSVVGIGQLSNGAGSESSNYNAFTTPARFFTQPNYVYLTLQQWQSLGRDVNSVSGDPLFGNASGGNFSLQNNSPAIALVPGSLTGAATVANSLLGVPTANGNYNAGLNSFVAPTLSMLSGTLLLNNGQLSTITPSGNTLTIQGKATLYVSNSSSLDLTGSVSNSGAFLSYGGLFANGNFTNSGAAIIGGSQIWAPGSGFNNAGGAATFQTDTGGTIAPAAYLAVLATAGVVNFASTQHLLSLNVSSGALVQVTNPASSRSIVITPSLVVTGMLDLGGNDLEIQGGNLQAITALIKQGYNNARWNGNGIQSTTAANDSTHLTTLGVILNTTLYGSGATLGLFDGTNPDVNDVLVRYTYYGDANLDGKVDGTDYSRIDNGKLNRLTGWYNGDFNYDGVVNGSDYTLIDNAFNTQTARLTSALADISANPTVQIALVPEPVADAVLLLLTPLFFHRRRRVQHSDGAV